MQINKSHSGISLLEILFVIAIIALIASISIPVYSNYTIRSKISNQLSFMGAIKQDVSNAIINNSSVSTINIDDPHINVDDNADIYRDIGSSGAQTVTGEAYILLRSTVNGSIIEWKCIITGENITQSMVPSTCRGYGINFYNALSQNSLIPDGYGFQWGDNPAPDGFLAFIDSDHPFTGDWYTDGGKLEVWNGFENSDGREAAIELDGHANEIVELSHDLNTEGFKKMNLSFEYYSRTGGESGGFEVLLGDEVVYTQEDFSPDWQNISIDLENNDDAPNKKLTIREAGADDSVGAIIDLKTIKVTPTELI
ncbi:type IV pili fiber building block protein [Francisella uliginis]|nr:type IV pili fiber building block protein [Francisella uliginis]